MKTKSEWKERIVKTAGAVDALYVESLRARCGSIRNGIAFRFGNGGGWVVDLEDLRRIIMEADALNASLTPRAERE